MPVMSCRIDNKAGYKYGDGGTCYPYTEGDDRSRKAAKRKAMLQGSAIESSKKSSGKGAGAVKEFDNSLNDFIDRVRSAFDKQFSRSTSDYGMVGGNEYCWATDIFSDYLIAKKGDKYYRVGMDVSDEAIVFDDREEWEEVKLSYVTEMLPFEHRRDVMLVYEIKGKYPEVPFADGVDYDELVAGDDDPVFVTLPIGKANVRSGNKRYYDEAFVQELEKQVLANKPVGLMGHLSTAQRATEFPTEAVHWVGAKRVGELLWAKGYLPPGEARDRLKRYKSTGKKIATSIDADLEGVWDDSVQGYRMKADTLKLAQIDIAPADRAGIADLSAVPHLTTEMAVQEAGRRGKLATRLNKLVDGKQSDSVSREDLVTRMADAADIDASTVNQILAGSISCPPLKRLGAFARVLDGDVESLQRLAEQDGCNYSTQEFYSEDDMDRSQVIREMTADDAKILPEPVRAAVLQSAPAAPEVKLVQELRQSLGVDDKVDLKTVVTEMRQAQVNQAKAAVKARIVEMATPDPKRPADQDVSVKVDAVRAVVIEMVEAKQPATVQEAETAYQSVISSGAVTELLKSKVIQTMGPPQGTPVAGQNGKTGKYFNIPKEETA